jgi:hypothetical protein
MTKRKPTKRTRKRGVPIQVYVSNAECAAMRSIARKRGVSLSTLVRGWIRRSAAAAGDTPASRARAVVTVDPRQLDAFEKVVGRSTEWLREMEVLVSQDPAAVGRRTVRGVSTTSTTCDCPLAHLSVHDACCQNA